LVLNGVGIAVIDDSAGFKLIVVGVDHCKALLLDVHIIDLQHVLPQQLVPALHHYRHRTRLAVLSNRQGNVLQHWLAARRLLESVPVLRDGVDAEIVEEKLVDLLAGRAEKDD
jgi:hypothetical protein